MEKIRGTWYVLKWWDFPLCRGGGEIVATGYGTEDEAKLAIGSNWVGSTYNDEEGNHYQTRYYSTIHEEAEQFAKDMTELTITLDDLHNWIEHPEKLRKFTLEQEIEYKRAYDKAIERLKK